MVRDPRHDRRITPDLDGGTVVAFDEHVGLEGGLSQHPVAKGSLACVAGHPRCHAEIQPKGLDDAVQRIGLFECDFVHHPQILFEHVFCAITFGRLREPVPLVFEGTRFALLDFEQGNQVHAKPCRYGIGDLSNIKVP